MNDPVFGGLTSILLLTEIMFYLNKSLKPIFLYLFPLLAIVYITGSIFKLYDQPILYDKFVHFFMCFVIALFLGTTFLKKKKDIVMILILTMVIGISWEIFERVEGLVRQDYMFETPIDSLTDLVADFIGAWFATKNLK